MKATTSSGTLTLALEYAERYSWHLLRVNGKRPIEPRGLKSATADPDLIRARWTEEPDAGIAVACRPSGLLVVDVDERPALPVEGAHPATVSFWSELWESPIVPELTNVDVHRLVMLAQLVEDFHRAENASSRVKLSQEIRLRGAEFGLSPISRRRLQWEIAKVAEAEDRRVRRAKRADNRPDPRLSEVS